MGSGGASVQGFGDGGRVSVLIGSRRIQDGLGFRDQRLKYLNSKVLCALSRLPLVLILAEPFVLRLYRNFKTFSSTRAALILMHPPLGPKVFGSRAYGLGFGGYWGL